MSRARAKLTTLVGLIDSDEEDLEVLSTKAQTVAKTMAPAKKSRAVATSRVTKSTRTRQAPSRKALTEKIENVQEEAGQSKGTKRSATEDIQALDEQDAEDNPKAGRGRARANKIQKIAEPEDELSVIQLETTVPAPVRRGRKPKTNVEPEVPETQQPEMEIPETQQVNGAGMITEDEQVEELPAYNQQGMSSAQRHQNSALFSAGRKPISASGSEMNDPVLRRRIGELTRKYESLEVKYRDLREIGVQEAERNFDRLKKQGEERAGSKYYTISVH
jgi:hypothetical protein